jgi:hypothetical protein
MVTLADSAEYCLRKNNNDYSSFKLIGALDNQIWLVTHSDALLRDVVGRPEYSVFHMVGASADKRAKQIERLTLAEDVQRAVLSLVGDIASYRPGKKLVVFEGGGDSEFDVFCTRELFSHFFESVNVISGGNKLRVRELHAVLDEASRTQVLPFKTFSITDQDSETNDVVQSPRFKWDVYHIENYLLEASFILKVMKDIEAGYVGNEVDVYDKLRSAASSCLGSLVRHKLSEHVNATIVSALDFKTDPKNESIGVSTSEAVQRSIDRIVKARRERIAETHLIAMEDQLRASFEADLATDAWRKTFRGRDVLHAFVRAQSCKASYEPFRNLIIARMKDAGFRPAGMQNIFASIEAQ